MRQKSVVSNNTSVQKQTKWYLFSANNGVVDRNRDNFGLRARIETKQSRNERRGLPLQ